MAYGVKYGSISAGQWLIKLQLILLWAFKWILWFWHHHHDGLLYVSVPDKDTWTIKTPQSGRAWQITWTRSCTWSKMSSCDNQRVDWSGKVCTMECLSRPGMDLWWGANYLLHWRTRSGLSWVSGYPWEKASCFQLLISFLITITKLCQWDCTASLPQEITMH